jgi:hypothetical protein
MAYSTPSELVAYATARGITLTGDSGVLLTRANDWVEAQTYKGEKTDPTQPNQWPRKDVIIFGYEIADDTVPDAIKRAEMQMAIEIDQGNDPYAPIKRQAIKEKVDVLEVDYSGEPNARETTTIRSVYPIIKEYLLSQGGLAIVRD